MVRCASGPQCPTLNDTIDGRAVLMAELLAQDLRLESKLLPRPQDLPPQPSAKSLVACKGATGSEAYQRCVMLQTPSEGNLKFLKCFEADNKTRAGCVAESVQNEGLKSTISCLGEDRVTSDRVLRCVEPQSDAKLIAIQNCITNSNTGEKSRDCLLQQALTSGQGALARCAAAAKSGEDAVVCLDELSPETQKARRIANCLRQNDANSAAPNSVKSCLTSTVGDAAGGYANCVTSHDNAELSQCILKSSPETRAGYQAYKCAAQGRDATSLIVNCTDGLAGMDDKTRRTLDCVANAKDDRSKLAGCAAGAVLTGDAARLAGCAATNYGATSFALCAAGPLMNEEWRIAAECAVHAGGQPYAFAACTATQLTIRELTKCFSSDFKDCYGENNTIIKAYTNAFKDITQGLGENNEFVKALDGLNKPLAVITHPLFRRGNQDENRD
jgi:hypothetical protein